MIRLPAKRSLIPWPRVVTVLVWLHIALKYRTCLQQLVLPPYRVAIATNISTSSAVDDHETSSGPATDEPTILYAHRLQGFIAAEGPWSTLSRFQNTEDVARQHMRAKIEDFDQAFKHAFNNNKGSHMVAAMARETPECRLERNEQKDKKV